VVRLSIQKTLKLCQLLKLKKPVIIFSLNLTNPSNQEMYYSVNVKLTTYNVFEFLKNKLKSFLLNHSHFFINPWINSEDTMQKIIRLFLQVIFPLLISTQIYQGCYYEDICIF